MKSCTKVTSLFRKMFVLIVDNIYLSIEIFYLCRQKSAFKRHFNNCFLIYRKGYMQNYLDELNENQRQAVLYNDGPSLVIAGAGSGKTRVLTYKIACLLDSGYAPWSILALTFTNKAAREMKERIAKQVGESKARYLWMGTFHSVFSRILRSEAEAIGFTSNFTIYDSSDSKSLIRAIIKELGLDEKEYKPGVVQSRISKAKNGLVSPEDYAHDKEMLEYDSSCKISLLHTIYLRYWNRCKQAGAMDFDDLLFYTYLLFAKFPAIRAKYSEQFKYVLVDEYQDTNYAQHRIVNLLTSDHQRVCVVGDDAQSIYSFRGANIDNILYFTKQYKNARVFKLEQNYRSTKAIVGAANSLIEKNRHQLKKSVFSERHQGEPVTVFNAFSDMEEGVIVTNKIVELRRLEQRPYSDFAILYRTNAQSRVFEEAFRKRLIPYKIYGGLSFYQRKEIKDVIAYFRLTVNPNDEEALKRVINYPARGIGATTVNKIINIATTKGLSLWNVISDPQGTGLEVNKGTLTKLKGFTDLINRFIADSAEKNAYDMGVDIINSSGMMSDFFQDDNAENLSRRENVNELINGMYAFYTSREEEGDDRLSLTDFLSEVSLLTDQDTDKEGDSDKVTLMTVHSSKGLEFPVVFIVGMEDGLFPSSLSAYNPNQLEEERRLFYVALTRAEELCFLSSAKNRFRYGKTESTQPSRFLRDIDEDYLKFPNERGASRFQEAPTDFKPFRLGEEPRRESLIPKRIPLSNAEEYKMADVSSSAAQSVLSVGQFIEHERFGVGEVIVVVGTGENTKATVRFKNAGEKNLLLKFARYKIIK